MATSTAGIQQLLGAERKASEMVAEARKRKARRLKEAKDEAAAEVDAYRAERDAEFKAYEDSHLGSKADVEARMDSETKAQLATLKDNVGTNKDKVIEGLLKMIETMDAAVHTNLRH